MFSVALLWVLVVSVCTLSASAYAQDVPDMATDRPDRTEASSVVPQGWIQVEAGAETGQVRITDNGLDERQTTSLYPSVLVRFGLLPAWELRLQVEYQEYRYAGASVSGLNPVSIGTKIAVCTEEGWRPEIAFIGHLTLPSTGQKDFQTEFVAPDFRFSVSHTLTEDLGVGYNLGMEWDGVSAMSTAIYTLVLGASILPEFGVFAEVFGEFPELGSSAHSLNGGLTWVPVTNLQLDASGSVGLNDAAPEYTVGAGVSFRLPVW